MREDSESQNELAGVGLVLFIIVMLAQSRSPNPLFNLAQTSSQTQPPIFVYGEMIDAQGNWVAPEQPGAMVHYLSNSGAQVVLIAANQAVPQSPYDQTLRQLITAGMQLEVRINPFTGDPSQGATQKTLADDLAEAKTLLDSGLYSIIMIDHAALCANPTLQQIIDGLKAQGWIVTENDTGWNRAITSLGVGVAWHRKSFDTMANCPPCSPSITQNDIDFISYIQSHDPSSRVVLDLEMPTQANTFSGLSLDTQKSLLLAWSQGQSQYGYVMAYPLFATNVVGGDSHYDSIAAGTYQYQVALIGNARPATVISSSMASTTSYSSSITSLSSSTSGTSAPQLTSAVLSNITRVESSTSTFTSNGVQMTMTSSYTTIMVVTIESTTATITTVTALASTIVTNPSQVSTFSTMAWPMIGGFPWESIIVGLILGMTAMAIARRRGKLKR